MIWNMELRTDVLLGVTKKLVTKSYLDMVWDLKSTLCTAYMKIYVISEAVVLLLSMIPQTDATYFNALPNLEL